MSLTGALSNAASGLAVNARSASLVSSNISNALTEGYGRRELIVVTNANSTHGGVRIQTVLRHSNHVLTQDRRQADAEASALGAQTTAARRIEQLVGSGIEDDSLLAIINKFEASLITAAADPSSEARLKEIARSASDVATKFNTISEGVQTVRMLAEAKIEEEIGILNAALARVEGLNARISGIVGQDRDPSALIDQRQQAIDEISSIVPVRVVEREREMVAIFSNGGEILIEDSARKLEFSPVNLIEPHMTLSNGLLNGLTIDGRQVDPSGSGMMSGGSLAAHFDVRDQLATSMQSELDGIARDLIERFQFGGPDTTLTAGDPGLFTDQGFTFLSTDEVGIANRLQLNASVVPNGPNTWKLRDGLNSVVPGNVGDSILINGLKDALNARVSPSSATLPSHASSLLDHVSRMTSNSAETRVSLEKHQVSAQAAVVAISEEEMAQGVDTDFELQNLMRIEQAYAANARVIQVVDELLDILLR